MPESIDIYTSTGLKFWRHPAAMTAYREGTGHTIIGTHVSPEGRCNLTCDYCSVTYRKTSFRIPLPVIQDYILALKTRGLKAVILTGGGEPTLYPQFNELVEWLVGQNLSLGLITNGTMTDRVARWPFKWVRVSINLIKDWETKIALPVMKLHDSTVVGASFINTGDQLADNYEAIQRLLDRLHARYLRVLPNCLNVNAILERHHQHIDKILAAKPKDPRIFHQYKMHEIPPSCTCHQSYFRPYLSEVNNGLVFPCDSVVLNDANAKFVEKYALCTPDKILDYLDGKFKHAFDPQVDCQGCVFVRNLKLLHAWKEGGEWLDVGPMEHEEFV